jgi:hypothetical protein
MDRLAAYGGALMAALALAGCIETVPPVAVVPQPVEDTCGLGPARNLIGLDAAALALLQRTQPVRVIGPNQPVTMDFNAERLNVFTDSSGRIERVTCG